VQQELIAEIHRTVNWPVVVTVDGKIIILEKSEFIDRDGSYIILLPDGNFEIINAEFSGLIVDRKNEFTQIWISEARLVVTGANEFSLSQQTNVFDYFSQLRIYDFFIVNQEHDII